MKINKKILAASFLALALLVGPSASYAKDNEHKEFKNSVKAELKAEAKSHRGSNSIWSRIFNVFIANRADAKSNNLSGSLSISGITAPTVLQVGATGTWTVKTSDSNNSPLTYSVKWGDENNSGAKMASDEVFVQTSTFTHAYAKAGTYKVKFTVKNSAGQEESSSVTVRVNGESNTQAPVISNVSVSSKNPKMAIVKWDTDIKSSSMIWFGKTSPVNTSGEANMSHKGKIKHHVLVLRNLEPNTKYYLVVGSQNGSNTLAKGTEISFTTPAVNTSSDAPVITSLSGPSTVQLGSSIAITVNAYDPNNGSLSYSADWGDQNSLMSLFRLNDDEPFTQSATLSHTYTKAGVYTATFKVKAVNGKEAKSKITITVSGDLTKPIISNIQTQVTANGSIVSWTTNEPTSSKVFYSATTPLDINASGATYVSSNTLTTNHSISIPGLQSNQKYYYIVQSTDAANNSQVSAEGNFTTSVGSQ